MEVVALAGRDHVVVAVRPDLDRPVELLGGDRGDRGKLVALRFLAAEAAAHAPHMHRDGVRCHAERMGDHVLDLARVLRGRPDGDLLVLAGDRHGDLALKVEVVLSADAHLAPDAPRRALERLAARRRACRVSGSATIGQPPATASTTSVKAGRGRYSTRASPHARRAASRVPAITAKIGWPWNSTRPSASTGSSWRPVGEMSLTPGTSAAVSTATTPGAERTASTSIETMSACASVERPRQACSVPAGSGMSSMYSASPVTCLWAESCRRAALTPPSIDRLQLDPGIVLVHVLRPPPVRGAESAPSRHPPPARTGTGGSLPPASGIRRSRASR